MKRCPKCQKEFSDDANFCPVDAARLSPIAAASAGGDSLTARFELGAKLGGGRTGAVHRATDKQGGAAVAIKRIAPEVVALPALAQRLDRELKQLERVQSAGVAKVLASGKRDDDSWWVALELIDGAQTLADAIAARGPIPLDQAAHLVEVIGEALIEAAQVGVVHRDLAPKNVLFAGDDIKLINFSLPVPTDDKVPGVPAFVAPEQVEGKPVDQRSNLYSLGALYYFVLTGQPVHAGDADEVHRAHLHGTIAPPSSLASVPAAVEALIVRALDRSPTKRFLTVRQFVDEVGRVGRGEAAGSTQPMGRAGRAKGELVQTLLGMRSGGGATPAPAPAPAPRTVSSPHVIAPPISDDGAIPEPTDQDAEGKFRETLWFKKGELDAQAAQTAQAAQASEGGKDGKDGKQVRDKADSMPIEKRYQDDGSVSKDDKQKYSLKTGATDVMPRAKDVAKSSVSGKVSNEELIGEMKQGRNKILLLIGLGAVVLAVAIFLIMS